MSAFRTSSGGRIDRTRPIRMIFDGQPVSAFEGDTIASALIAADIRLIGRSFKYHRPRGIWGAGVEEPNAIFDVTFDGQTTANQRATTIPARDGMAIRSVNARPDAKRDRFAFIDLVSRFIPAGFYYKTFIFPNWRLYEPMIRDMAGLGSLNPDWKAGGPASHINRHADLLVIGAGPAGLAAAEAAAISGRKVLMVDDRQKAGGALSWRDRNATIDAMPATEWVNRALERIRDAGGEILLSTTAFGIYDHGLVGLCQRHSDGRPDSLWRVRTRHVVLATGAIERPLAFANNDLPGIMSTDAALAYLHEFGVVAGQTIVIAGNNSSIAEAALALASAGADVTLVDSRADAEFPAGIDGLAGRRITTARGKTHVTGVVLDDGRELRADCVLVSGGFTPTIHLYGQARGKLKWNDELQGFVPGQTLDALTVAGAANGEMTLRAAIHDGLAAASRITGRHIAMPEMSNGEKPFAISPHWPEPEQKGRVWIDFQNDVTAKDIELAARENFVSVEHLKRYTTLGMATDQGKTSNLAGLALMAAATGRTIPEVGTTTYRPPFSPVPLATMAGRRSGKHFNPVRRLPLENVHRADGAVLQEYGGWLRPAYYGSGPAAEEISREARAARQSVALFDGSTLGKIEVIGPQAAEFLDFIYYNTVSTLKPGRCRYGFILTETGFVYDDGVLVRLSENHFVVSCSSSHVAGVYGLLEDWRQDRFDRNKVFIHDATGQYATLTVTGPKSRALLERLDLGVALDDASLPHMAIGFGRFEGERIRVARVSFTGDRAYELSIRADRAQSLWMALRHAGKAFDATLMGLEALTILRAEKGFIIIGKDTDGLTRPMDLGMEGPLRNKASEFIGKRSLLTEDARRENRMQLVGLDVLDAEGPLEMGAHGVEQEDGKARSIGYVTSSYQSPTLGRPIALGLIERGRSRFGEIIDVRHFGAIRKARIADPCAFDKEGVRLHA